MVVLWLTLGNETMQNQTANKEEVSEALSLFLFVCTSYQELAFFMKMDWSLWADSRLEM